VPIGMIAKAMGPEARNSSNEIAQRGVARKNDAAVITLENVADFSSAKGI
jgi:hypothetical protein